VSSEGCKLKPAEVHASYRSLGSNAEQRLVVIAWTFEFHELSGQVSRQTADGATAKRWTGRRMAQHWIAADVISGRNVLDRTLN